MVESAQKDHIDVLEQTEQTQADERGGYIGQQLAAGQRFDGWG